MRPLLENGSDYLSDIYIRRILRDLSDFSENKDVIDKRGRPRDVIVYYDYDI